MKKAFILAEIYRQNIQWKSSDEFFSDLKGIQSKRKLYAEILPYLDQRQIISITGLRRTGKTILLKQIIQKIMLQTVLTAVLFLTFDEAIFPGRINLADYLNEYLEKVAPENGPLYIFLDEIQYAAKWQHILKRYYDTDNRIKFFVSGSSSLFLRKYTTESLAGRIYEFSLPVLSFPEYLQLKNFDKKILSEYLAARIPLGAKSWDMSLGENFFRQYGAKMEKEFENYLQFGQFPEIVGENDLAVIRKYLADSVYKKTIEYDIPKIFGVDKVDELKLLFQVLVNEVGSVIETGNIAREIEVDEKTVKKYLNYFQESFLIHLVYNFSKSVRKSRRQLKKVYLGSTNFPSIFHDWKNSDISSAHLGFLAENYCLFILADSFEYVSFLRIRQDEIDFVATNDLLDNGQRKYFEVKYRESIPEKSVRRGAVMAGKTKGELRIISKNIFEKREGVSIVPAWLLK